MIFLIPVLLLLILIVLLVGAAKVKASLLRNFQLMLACTVVAILWTKAQSIPVEFWWSVGIILLAGLAISAVSFAVINRRERAELRVMAVEAGLTPSEVDRYMSLKGDASSAYYSEILQRNVDNATKARMIEYGMTEVESDQYAGLIRAGKTDEAGALHLAAMNRKNAKQEPARLPIRGYH